MGFFVYTARKSRLEKTPFPSSDPRGAKVLLGGNYIYLPVPVRCGCFSKSS